MKFFTVLVFSIIVISLQLLPLWAKDFRGITWLMTGEQKKLTGLGGSVTLTNPQSITAKQSGSILTLIGKKPGRSFLVVGGKNLEVVVYPTRFFKAKSVLDKFLRESIGFEMEMSPDKIYIKGKVRRVEDWVTIAEIKDQFKEQIKLDLSASLEILDKVKSAIERELKSRSLFSTRAEIRNEKLTLLTTTKDPRETKIVNLIADKWGLEAANLTNSLELKPMIEIEITIAETKKNKLSHLGLTTPGSYSATVWPTSDLTSVGKVFDPSQFELNTLLMSRVGKILASPKILCRSGEVAQFIAGGEIPIKIANMRMVDVVWKKYGVILNITPLADIQNAISVKLVTEISLIDEAHYVDNIPGFLTNRIETHFDLRGEKTIALSGLIKNEVGRGSQDTPLLSTLPILGELFKSKAYKENKTELVILVTPRVISPETAPEADINNFWKEDD